MTIPSNNLVPGVYTEIDKSGAVQGTPAKPHRALLVGIVPAVSTGPKNAPVTVTSADEVLATWGASQLAHMAWAWFRRNRRVKTDVLAIPEAGAGQASVGKIAASGTASASGVFTVVLNGLRIQVGVTAGDTASDVHSAIKSAIDDAIARLPHQIPVSASVSATPDVEITATFKGAIGNAMTLSVEGSVAGVTLSVTGFAGGSGDEDVSTGLAALGDTQYDTIVRPTTANAATWHQWLDDRWGPMVQKDGMSFVGASGSHGALTTLGTTLNSQYTVVVPCGASPTPPWVWAAQAAAGDALDPDTPRPRRGMVLADCVPPADGQAFNQEERQLLLEAGISTWTVTAGGQVAVERLITTYTKDPVTGVPDPVFRNLSTMRNLAYLRWSWNTRLSLKYPDYNLADDGVQVDPGVKVVTPSVIRGEAIAWFIEMERAGRVENFEQFKADLSVARDANDPERVNVVSPPDLSNELVTLATRFAFRL